MNRIYNFSAGPAMLPEEVLKDLAKELVNYGDSGMSVMEMSHRSSIFEDIINKTKENLIKLLNIPNNYEILFLQGGASLQFSMIPLNLMKNKKADYIVTGQFAKKAKKEGELFGDIKVIATSEDKNFSYIPNCDNLDIRDDADYVYICENNTIYGTKFKKLPNTKGKDLVADLSSCILSEPIDVTKYGLIFAGAQKNIGPAGVTIVIIRKDLIRKELVDVPTMLRYDIHSSSDSMYNTPPCYNIYVCGKVFEYLLKTGGLEKRKEINEYKSKLLYDYLDNSKLFRPTAKPFDRSNMNVTFLIGDNDLENRFIYEAAKNGLVNLKGHRSVGGMRASIYNAMPVSGVEALVEFMKKFEMEV